MSYMFWALQTFENGVRFFFEALFVSLRYRMHVCRRFVKSSFGAFLL